METSLIITSMSGHIPPLDTCVMEKKNPRRQLSRSSFCETARDVVAALGCPGWKNVTLKSFVHPASFFWKSEDAHCRKTATGVTAGARNANVQGKSWAVCSKVCKAEGVGVRRLLEEGP